MAPQLRFPWHAPPVGRFSRARATAAAPRMATAAVRIPLQAIQLPIKGLAKGPQIFIHEGARQALERRLELAFGGPVQLGVTVGEQALADGLGVRERHLAAQEAHGEGRHRVT